MEPQAAGMELVLQTSPRPLAGRTRHRPEFIDVSESGAIGITVALREAVTNRRAVGKQTD